MPKDNGGEGEGWLIALVNRLDVLRNDVVILDAQDVAAGPVATIHLPFKLKLGLHGNFVDQRDILDWEARRANDGGIGPVRPADRPLPWQEELMRKGVNGSQTENSVNGVNGEMH